MPTMTFINLPVKDLADSTAFFSALGFSFDEQFTDDTATRMIISEESSVMLMAESVFDMFVAPAQRATTPAQREVIVGLSADSRAQVDDLVDKAVAAGAHVLGEPQDDGFMYMRGFLDLDGHQWSFIHMDMAAIPES